MSNTKGRNFIVKGITLVPADDLAADFMRGCRQESEVIVTVRRPRSPAHHRWFMALLSKVVDNSEQWNDHEELLDAIKDAVGHTERRIRLDGTVYLAPKSIDFASMDEEEFKRWKIRAMHVLGIALGYDPEILMREVDASQRRVRA